MASTQMRRPEESAKATTASAQPQGIYVASSAQNARSVTVDFSITGSVEAVRYFLNAVVHTKNLEALQFFVEHYRSQLQTFTANVNGQTVSMEQIVPAIRRSLGQ